MTDDPVPSLADQLALISGHVRTAMPVIADETDRLVARLRAARVGVDAIKPGDRLPPFALPRDDGRLVFSDELLAAGPLVLSLNRGHWCPFCSAEIDALEGIRPEIEAAGGRVVAILPEGPALLRQIRERGIGFDLLVDVDCAYALELSLAIWVGESLFDIFTAAGIFGIRGLNASFLPIPATIIIERGGRVAAAWTDPDFRMRLEPAEILATLLNLPSVSAQPGARAGTDRAPQSSSSSGTPSLSSER